MYEHDIAVRVSDPVFVERFWRKVLRGDRCWEWQGAQARHGYGLVILSPARARVRRTFAHRVAWTAVHGEIEGGFHVCHRCDNPPCCNPDHLFIGTAKDNALDRQAKGRTHVGNGADNPRARLTEADVRTIRQMGADGVASAAIARAFGISPSATRYVLKRQTWRDVE